MMSRLAALFDDSARLQILVDCKRGMETLLANKVRSLLTMLGMIFGVAAVVSMMSIGAGAQQQVLAFIEQLGVRNLIVEAREADDFMSFQKARKVSPGLTERDLRVIRANVPASPRRRRASDSCHRSWCPSRSATRRRSTASNPATSRSAAFTSCRDAFSATPKRRQRPRWR